MLGILITLSPKRLAVLEEDPQTLLDVIDARDEQTIPGLLDLGNAWDALDRVLSDRGKDALLGDAIVGRSGRKFGDGNARLLDPTRVTEIAKRLATLAPDHVATRYVALAGAKAHANVGDVFDPDERAALEILVGRIAALYQEAARQQHSMLTVLI